MMSDLLLPLLWCAWILVAKNLPAPCVHATIAISFWCFAHEVKGCSRHMHISCCMTIYPLLPWSFWCFAHEGCGIITSYSEELCREAAVSVCACSTRSLVFERFWSNIVTHYGFAIAGMYASCGISGFWREKTKSPIAIARHTAVWIWF